MLAHFARQRFDVFMAKVRVGPDGRRLTVMLDMTTHDVTISRINSTNRLAETARLALRELEQASDEALLWIARLNHRVANPTPVERR